MDIVTENLHQLDQAGCRRHGQVKFVPLCFIHFEIAVDPCNLIGSQQCDLFAYHTIFLL